MHCAKKVLAIKASASACNLPLVGLMLSTTVSEIFKVLHIQYPWDSRKEPTRRKIILENLYQQVRMQFGSLAAAVLRTPQFNRHNPFGIWAPLKQRASKML